MEADAESLLTIRVSLGSEGNHLTLRRRVDYLSDYNGVRQFYGKCFAKQLSTASGQAKPSHLSAW